MSKRRPKAKPRRIDPRNYEATEQWAGESWVVKPIRGSSSTKNYRCPGCDQEIPPATPHVVVWPEETIVGEAIDARRHWHSACWKARDRRKHR